MRTAATVNSLPSPSPPQSSSVLVVSLQFYHRQADVKSVTVLGLVLSNAGIYERLFHLFLAGFSL